MLSSDKVDHQGPSCPFLIRQGSLSNLTLDEINSQMGNFGKPLNTVNLDELVKNVICAEESLQLMQNPCSSSLVSSSSSSASSVLGNFNLNKSISKKTIDEVWSEIADQECAFDHPSITERQLTLGETTLEEFLVRAGVLSLGINQGINKVVNNPQPLSAIDPMDLVKQQGEDNWLQPVHTNIPMPMPIAIPIQAGSDHDSHFQVSSFDNQGMLENFGYLDDHQLELAIPGDATTSSDSYLGVVDQRKRRYCTDEMMEKSIERRQRRMIKNRVSAARSRARKQAYTKQLEHDVLQLKATNNWLRRRKKFETILHSNPPSKGPKYQLRRTSSAQL